MLRPLYAALGVLTVGFAVMVTGSAYGQVHSRVHPAPAVLKQVIASFDNPEGTIFSADGRFVFVTSAAELGSARSDGFGWGEGESYISKLEVLPSGELKMVNDKLITGLTGGVGMGVLPVSTATFPAGTIFACLPHAPLRDADGQVITDRNRMRSKLLAFNTDGQTLGEIDMGHGSLFEEINGTPVLIPNAIGFDASGNLFVTDTALAGGQFEPPFEDKGGVWMIPAGAIDDLAAAKRPAQPPIFLPVPGKPDGVEVSHLDGKVYINTVGLAAGAPDPIGGGIYALTMENFQTGDVPPPIDRDLGALDGLDFTRGGTMLNTQIRGGFPSYLTVNCPGKIATMLAIEPGGSAADLSGPADIAIRQLADGSHLVVIPELMARDDTPGDDEVTVVLLPPDFDAACE
jgi:hypothetical protein